LIWARVDTPIYATKRKSGIRLHTLEERLRNKAIIPSCEVDYQYQNKAGDKIVFYVLDLFIYIKHQEYFHNSSG
jgi:hypothetical protein